MSASATRTGFSSVSAKGRWRWRAGQLGACFRAADWSRPNAHVAKRLAVDKHTVSRLRTRLRQAGFEVPLRVWEPRVVSRKQLLLAGLGEKTDIELAERFGVSRERVRQLRAEMGIPVNAEATRRRAQERRQRQEKERRREMLPRLREAVRVGHSPSDVAVRLGVPLERVRRWAEHCGITLPRRGRTLQVWLRDVDWTQLNGAIAVQCGVTARYVASVRYKLRSAGFPVGRSPLRGGAVSSKWNFQELARVNWSLPVLALARRLRTEKGSVYRLRRKFRRHIESAGLGRWQPSSGRRRLLLLLRITASPYRSATEVAGRLGIPVRRVREMAARHRVLIGRG